MESTSRKPGTGPREAAVPAAGEPRAHTPPGPPHPNPAGSAERPETARVGEPVTAYDHLWFQRRPLT